MITWAELLARPTNEAFGDMVRKVKSTPEVLQIQDRGMNDKACARVYFKNKKVRANLIGPYVQARRELRNETIAWARSVEPWWRLQRRNCQKQGGKGAEKGEGRGA
jgi:hypothetical protein